MRLAGRRPAAPCLSVTAFDALNADGPDGLSAITSRRYSASRIKTLTIQTAFNRFAEPAISRKPEKRIDAMIRRVIDGNGSFPNL